MQYLEETKDGWGKPRVADELKENLSEASS